MISTPAARDHAPTRRKITRSGPEWLRARCRFGRPDRQQAVDNAHRWRKLLRSLAFGDTGARQVAARPSSASCGGRDQKGAISVFRFPRESGSGTPRAPGCRRRSRSGLPAPLWKVVALSAARGCDDQTSSTSIRGGAPARAAVTRAGALGRRLPEEITISASDQQSHSTRRGDLGEEFVRPHWPSQPREPHSLGF